MQPYLKGEQQTVRDRKTHAILKMSYSSHSYDGMVFLASTKHSIKHLTDLGTLIPKALLKMCHVAHMHIHVKI